MWSYFEGHIKTFWKGFIGSYVVWGGVLFATPPLLNNLFIAYILKVAGAGVLAFVSGLCTVVAKYYFEHKLKHKIFKDGKQTDQRKAKENIKDAEETGRVA